MDIYGKSLIIETTLRKAEKIQRILDYMLNLWPAGVVDWEHDGFYVYRDDTAADAWELFGRTDYNAEDMIQVILDNYGLTIVHENLNEDEVKSLYANTAH